MASVAETGSAGSHSSATSRLGAWTRKLARPSGRGAPLVLLLAGSFNPVTNQHLRLLELARDHARSVAGADVIGGLVSPVNDGYGKPGLLPAHHRVAMCEAAVASSSWISVDAWECQQPANQRTLSVLDHVAEGASAWLLDYPSGASAAPEASAGVESPSQASLASVRTAGSDATTVDVRLVCGADLLESFIKPGVWSASDLDAILGIYGVVCVTRSGVDVAKLIHEHDVLHRYANNIWCVTEWVRNDISSTAIRRLVRRHASIKYLVADPVIEYIQRHKLYQP